MKFLAPLFSILMVALVPPADAAPLSGTKSVGPTGDYASLTAAIADIQTQALGGALVLELQAAYVSTVDTFPLMFPTLNGASAVNTLTVRPQAGATGLSITSADTTAATVDLNGAQYVTLDGRPGGVGTAKQLTIENTSTAGVTLRFINEGSNNTIKFITLKGVNNNLGTGTVVFSTTTGPNGNDNNAIDTCDIRDGASTPAIAIFAFGTTTTTAQFNSGNTVTNCNIFNFYNSAGNSLGVFLGTGSADWTISGNSFYQTASRAAVAFSVIPIFVSNSLPGSFTVTGNFIGGSAPSCGGTAWTTTGTSAAYRFIGMQINADITMASSAQGNTIANIVWTSSSNANTLPGVWTGIYVTAGNVNVGTATGNIIGNGTGTGSISVTTSGTSGTTFGIGNSGSGSGTVNIANNTIGSITANGTDTTVSASLVGIQMTGLAGGANTVSNNLIGSTTTANSLNAATSSSSSTVGQQVIGILSSRTGGASITGNTVANLNNNYTSTATAGQVLGIVTSAGVNTITGNSVRNLSTTSQNGDATTSQSVFGIADTSTSGGQVVSQNVVHSLANTTPSVSVCVTGIYFAGPSGTNLIARNLVHSLAISTTSTSSLVFGMHFAAGAFTAQNNMIRVGLWADGTSTAGASVVRGIYDNGTTAGRNFYHNSVYVGGTQTSGTTRSATFQSVGVSNARSFQNNIFVNARSNVGATTKHYAVIYGGTSANPSGLTAGGNLFLASGTGGVLGLYNTADRTTLTTWQTATGKDATSAVGDPLFIAPAGDASAVDLHLQATNPAESGGVELTDSATGVPATVVDDFDGQTRSMLTPVDVGADAGNFTLSSDVFAPRISYPLLGSGSTSNRVLTGWATIMDVVGVSGGASAPRLYFKKSTDADIFGGNTAADNGWKYVAGTGSGPYSFTLDYSIINGGGVSAGDTVQYFVVAQDAANNLASNPVVANASANPPVQNISAKPVAGVNSFTILGGISGTVTVGSGGTYPSLSGAGGLFAALNASTLTGNVVANITSDLTETGGVTLSPLNANDYPQPTVTIQPDSTTMRTISGAATAGLITLNGADRVTMDGRSGGTGRYLTFRNTSAGGGASTILFQNDSSNNTLRNCVVEGSSTSNTLGVIGFSTGTVTGNDNNVITGCQVRDLSTMAGVPSILVGSNGSSAAVANSNNTISNCELFNFNSYGIFINGGGNESWTVSGNNIHEINVSNGNIIVLEGIDIRGGGTNMVTGNFIHDLVTSGSQSIGVRVASTGYTTISCNIITALGVNPTTSFVFGIYTEGFGSSTLQVLNNQITLAPVTSVSSALYGLYIYDTTGSVTNAFCNTILMGGSESGANTSWASLRQGNSLHTARNNLFLNLRTGGGVNHFAAGNRGTGGTYAASNNVYAGTGATAANFMDLGSGSTTPVSFATWQSLTGDTSTSANNPGGNYSIAMFVDAANGDLHLVPGGNALVNNAGTPIAGVTTDYDGDMRNGTSPTIGADEIPLPSIAVAQGGALSDGGSTDFGSVMFLGSNVIKTFTVTNPGTADLTSLVVTKDGTNAGDFTVSALSGTSVPVGSGSVTFTVTLTPSASGSRSAAIHLASNVVGAKNPFDITLTGTGQTAFEAWAVSNTVANDPDAVGGNGVKNLLNFAFGVNPVSGGSGALTFNGTFGSGGTIAAVGQPITRTEGTDFRALFVRRKDFAAVGLTYTVQFTNDLLGWQDSTDTPAVLADDGTNQIVSVPFPSGFSTKGFFRVSTSLP